MTNVPKYCSSFFNYYHDYVNMYILNSTPDDQNRIENIVSYNSIFTHIIIIFIQELIRKLAAGTPTWSQFTSFARWITLKTLFCLFIKIKSFFRKLFSTQSKNITRIVLRIHHIIHVHVHLTCYEPLFCRQLLYSMEKISLPLAPFRSSRMLTCCVAMATTCQRCLLIRTIRSCSCTAVARLEFQRASC